MSIHSILNRLGSWSALGWISLESRSQAAHRDARRTGYKSFGCHWWRRKRSLAMSVDSQQANWITCVHNQRAQFELKLELKPKSQFQLMRAFCNKVAPLAKYDSRAAKFESLAANFGSWTRPKLTNARQRSPIFPMFPTLPKFRMFRGLRAL